MIGEDIFALICLGVIDEFPLVIVIVLELRGRNGVVVGAPRRVPKA